MDEGVRAIRGEFSVSRSWGGRYQHIPQIVSPREVYIVSQ